jgi:hypothetical protein
LAAIGAETGASPRDAITVAEAMVMREMNWERVENCIFVEAQVLIFPVGEYNLLLYPPFSGRNPPILCDLTPLILHSTNILDHEDPGAGKVHVP